jgi:hypothetical protein
MAVFELLREDESIRARENEHQQVKKMDMMLKLRSLAT